MSMSIGVTLGVILVAMGAFLVARRHRKKQHGAVYIRNNKIYRKKELGSMTDSSVRSELHGQGKAMELDASRPWVEAPSGQEKEKVRTSVHELAS